LTRATADFKAADAVTCARPGCTISIQDRANPAALGAWRIKAMNDSTDQFAGGCLCGAIRFVATGQPKGVYWCHCESCRKHSGAPASVFVAFERSAYTVTQGEISKFDSTPGRTRRGFCPRCGSTLTCESAGLPTETHFYVGAFERSAELKPTRHVFREEHLPWFPALD
jgi:hypothetical protein